MKYLALLFTVFLLASCSSSKFLSSTETGEHITDLDYLEPIAFISYVNKGNKAEYSDSLSTITRYKMDSIISVNKQKLKLNNKITINNDTINLRISNEIANAIQTITLKRNLYNIRISPTLDSILESNNQRYGLTTIATGFGRKKGNYAGQIAKGTAIGILTLGMYTPVPIKSDITLYALIIDSEKNVITFYNKKQLSEKSPTDEKNISKLLYDLFDGYLYNTEQN